MKVNGQFCERAETVAALLALRGLDPQRVAVELNGDIVPRDAFATTALAEDSVLEIVSFVGGG